MSVPKGKLDEHQKVEAVINDLRTQVTIRYDPEKLIMQFSEADNFKKTYTGKDIYVCLAKVRADFPHITFLCKGAKINVMPSRMASQMGAGLVAYEMTMGRPATRVDIVHIFDYEEENLTTDPQVQINFFKNWLISLGAEDYEKFN
ncbi:MAG: hypothetical protein GAK37_00264 [Pseudomonas sp.]|nr:MAG: hypothetical protein GAK37_00264 [Pseudomonas sp.]